MFLNLSHICYTTSLSFFLAFISVIIFAGNGHTITPVTVYFLFLQPVQILLPAPSARTALKNNSVSDFRLPPLCKLNRCSSGVLCSVNCQLGTDVSEQPVLSTFRCQADTWRRDRFNCLLIQLGTATLRLTVRSWLDVPTFATRRLHACHHARVPSGGRWNCGREMSGKFCLKCRLTRYI